MSKGLIKIKSDSMQMEGMLEVPPDAAGIVLFAHGSGSSRFSLRNQYVANVLNESNIGTLLLDLLTSDEEHDRNNVFDVELLSQRLQEAIKFLSAHPITAELEVGLFGASTGAAAALTASTMSDVYAVVSRGGRPDLAIEILPLVTAPTLLIVGGEDFEVLELNRIAAAKLNCQNKLAIVPNATHLFEEPGTLEHVSQLTSEWFISHLP